MIVNNLILCLPNKYKIDDSYDIQRNSLNHLKLTISI